MRALEKKINVLTKKEMQMGSIYTISWDITRQQWRSGVPEYKRDLQTADNTNTMSGEQTKHITRQ